MTTSYPPQHSLPSVPVAPSAALKLLQTYLAASENNAYLLPNATLQPTGPVARGESLTLHNLRRVEAGLRGEWLAPELEIGATEAVAGEESQEVAGKATDGQEGWMDLDEYQREQSIEGAVDTEIEVVEEERLDSEGQGDIKVGKAMTELDKKARKKAKMERKRAERSEKEAKKRAEKKK